MDQREEYTTWCEMCTRSSLSWRCCLIIGPLSLEDDDTVAVHQYPVLEVPADGSGEDAPLHLAPETHQVA